MNYLTVSPPQYKCLREKPCPLIKVSNVIRFMLLGIGILTFTGFYFASNLQGMFLSILVVFSSNLWFSLSKLSARLTYTLFLLSFFSFMLGRMTVDLVTRGKVLFNFSYSISAHMLLSIFLSLIALQIGFRLTESFQPKIVISPLSQNPDLPTATHYQKRLEQYAKLFFYISAFFFFIANLEQFLFIRSHSYTELYTSFKSSIPRIFQIIGNMNLPFFAVYLMTYPQKKTCTGPFVIYALLLVTVLLTGDRGNFIIDIAIVVIYIFWRQHRDHEIWISKKITVLCIACIPILIAGLSLFVGWRENRDLGNVDFFSQFTRFFKVTGKSVDILGYGVEYKKSIPQHGYSLGELIDYAVYNPIIQKYLGIVKPNAYTTEYATTMHSFAHIITYMVTPDEYLTGYGLGSAYIAEVYYDFGYIGIILCNFIYGLLLASFYKLDNKTPIMNAALLISLRIMYYVPRGAAIQPLSYILNITTITALIFIWIAAKLFPQIRFRRRYHLRYEKNTVCD